MPRAYIAKIYYENGVRHSYPGIYESLQSGKARIGWSYNDNHDLRIIEQMKWASLAPDQQEAAKCRGFLVRIVPGDYLLYPHQPTANHLLIAQVKEGPDGEYAYDSAGDALDGDFRSYRGCILLTPNPIPYDDKVLLPYVQKRLGLQVDSTSYWKLDEYILP